MLERGAPPRGWGRSASPRPSPASAQASTRAVPPGPRQAPLSTWACLVRTSRPLLPGFTPQRRMPHPNATSQATQPLKPPKLRTANSSKPPLFGLRARDVGFDQGCANVIDPNNHVKDPAVPRYPRRDPSSPVMPSAWSPRLLVVGSRSDSETSACSATGWPAPIPQPTQTT